MNGKKLGDKDKPWAPPMMSRQGEVFISFKKQERKKEGQREGRNQRRREGGKKKKPWKHLATEVPASLSWKRMMSISH